MPQPDSATWTIPADPQRVARLVLDAAGFLGRHGIEGRPLFTAQLVLEEIVNNVVQHAFAGVASRELRVTATVDPDGVSLTVEDDGRPFDPLVDAPPADTESPLEERPVGGLGLHLVKQFATRLTYERVGETNRVRMHVGTREG